MATKFEFHLFLLFYSEADHSLWRSVFYSNYRVWDAITVFGYSNYRVSDDPTRS